MATSSGLSSSRSAARRRPNEEDYIAIAKCLKTVARYAAGLGIEIGFEPVNR